MKKTTKRLTMIVAILLTVCMMTLTILSAMNTHKKDDNSKPNQFIFYTPFVFFILTMLLYHIINKKSIPF